MISGSLKLHEIIQPFLSLNSFLFKLVVLNISNLYFPLLNFVSSEKIWSIYCNCFDWGNVSTCFPFSGVHTGTTHNFYVTHTILESYYEHFFSELRSLISLLLASVNNNLRIPRKNWIKSGKISKKQRGCFQIKTCNFILPDCR